MLHNNFHLVSKCFKDKLLLFRDLNSVQRNVGCNRISQIAAHKEFYEEKKDIKINVLYTPEQYF